MVGKPVDEIDQLGDPFEGERHPQQQSENSSKSMLRQRSIFSTRTSTETGTSGEEFHRIKISDDQRQLMHMENLQDAATPLLTALGIRERFV